MKTFRILALALALSVTAGAACAAEDAGEEKLSFIPTVSGTLRAFYRQSTTDGSGRFQVANARLSAAGDVMPWLDYYMQVDFCDNGKIKILDAFAGFKPVRGLKLMLGQMRVPFSVEATRAPWKYYFADPSLTNNFGNLRSVGFKAGYSVPGTGLYAEGGVFNATDMIDHYNWNSAMTYSVKTSYTTPWGLRPEIAFMSRVPGGAGAGVRVNQVDAALSWSCGRFFAEAEYIYRHYTGGAHKPSHAYDFFVDYGLPVRSRIVDKVSFQARLDGITDASSGMKDGSGKLPTTIAAHKRLTGGVTASRLVGPLFCAFKLNYEHCFYDKTEGRIAAASDSQLVAGMVVKF